MTERSTAASTTECAFCGSDLGWSTVPESIAKLMREFHETFTLLVLADYDSAEYHAHLDEARRILDVQL